MNVQRFRARWSLAVLGLAGLCVVVGCGLFQQNVTSRPPELVVWGDPASDSEGTTVRDVNDLEDRFVVIGADGGVQFSDGTVCNDCTVTNATIRIDDTARMHVRFGTGPGDGDIRRPYLVSTDGFYIELVGADGGVTFQEEDLRFEEPDDPTDDLGVQAATAPNPLVAQSRTSPLCGPALLLFAPLTALGMAFMRRGRGR